MSHKHRHHKEHKELRDTIIKRLGMMTFVKPVGYWLDTGSKDGNAVLGSERKGLPSGKMWEAAGKNHGGKTAVANILSGMAQRQHNAFVIEIQLENSADAKWSARLGVNQHEDNYYLLLPRILIKTKLSAKDKFKAGKKKASRKVSGKAFLQNAELIFKEAEEVMLYVKERWPERPIWVTLDSVANLQTEMQVSAGDAGETNMRANLDRAQFLSRMLARWCQLAMNYDAWIFLINQVRTNPTKVFGNPEGTSGGNALEHNAHNRLWVRRVKDGRMKKNGKTIGLKGKLVNYKNKSGGGSEAFLSCGFMINFQKRSEKMLRFTTIKNVEGEE